MKFRFKQAIPFLLFLLIAFTWFFLADAFFWDVTFSILQPLYLYSLVTLPLAVILIFVKEKVFNSWFKFALWWIPLSILLIGPESGGGGLPVYNFGNEDVAWLMGVLFSAISISRIFSQIFVEPHFPSGWGRVLRSWAFFSSWWVLFSASLVILRSFPDVVHPPLSFFTPLVLLFVLSIIYVVASILVVLWNSIALHYAKKLTMHP